MGNFYDNEEENNRQKRSITCKILKNSCFCYDKNNDEKKQVNLSYKNNKNNNNKNQIEQFSKLTEEDSNYTRINTQDNISIKNNKNIDEKKISKEHDKIINNNNKDNNKEKISNKNDNIIEINNNQENNNENIISFIDRLFPKRNKIGGSFAPQIPPGTTSPFVENISEKITIIEEGQFIQVKMDINVFNVPQNVSSITYGIRFDSQIYDVHCNLNNFEYDSHNIKFHLNLENKEIIHIEFDYNKKILNICEYYRNEFILINNIFKGAVGKYEVIIPEKYILICEEKEIFYPLNKNTYVWNGVIPNEGLNEWFKISYKKAKWIAQFSQEIENIYLNDHIRMVEITIPKYYKGGNLELENYEIKCSLGSGVDNKYIFEEGNLYRIKMENVASDKVFYQIISTFHNNILSNWIIDIEDEKKITKIDDEIKNSFRQIVNQIFEKDKSNNPNFFKIGKYVHEYLTYDKTYSGREMDVYQIYKEKRGVCEHFTILYNTLLNSIDIPAIYVCGFANNGEGGKTQINDVNNERHAWTLAKIEGRWIPLDATWGILKGILPVSHIFQHYFKTKIKHTMIGEVKVSEISEDIVYERI